MNLFLFTCLVSIFVTSSADKKVLLEPNGKPFPALRTGTLEEIFPKPRPVQSRIVSGNFASDGQLPYQVGLLINFGTPNVYAWCGGTILHSEWIVTAAHCTSGATSIEVRLGSVQKNSPRRISWGYQNHIHPGWGSDGHDIALVKMQWVDFNVNMAPADLPHRNGQYSEYVNSRVTASGWGGINDHGQGSDVLKYVTMSVIDKNACAAVYGSNAKRPSIMCTNTKGVGSTCSGDSGGPLVLEKTRTLVGIVTFGAAGSCSGGLPAGFARITYFLDWIKDVSGVSW